MSETLSLTVKPDGTVLCIVNELSKTVLPQDATIRRASHVEPDGIALRVAFHALRHAFGDKGWMARFTRLWPCRWRVNTAPIGGPILRWRHVYSNEQIANIARIGWSKALAGLDNTATWRDRQAAIDAEIKYLNATF